LAQNCAHTLPVFFSYLEYLGREGLTCNAILGENGSRDQTRDLILRARDRGVQLLDKSFIEGYSNRYARMAAGRQALLDCSVKRKVRCEYICVADLDNVILEPPAFRGVSGAISRLRQDRMLFGVGASSQPVYYDLLSLRAPSHDYSALIQEIASAKKRPLSYFQFHKRRIYCNQRAMTEPRPIECLSSFNGFCIYDAEDYRIGTYRSDQEAGVCEHVTLNLSIARATGKHMTILPELYIRTPADHGPVGFVRFWYDRIAERVRR
jgi:hypothetical protein